MYGEDVDLCYNIINSGYKIYYLGDCRIIHEKGASSKNNTFVRKAFYDSMKIYYNKHKKNKKFDFLVNAGIGIARKLNL
jgi:GT2 family glycosyltransferase